MFQLITIAGLLCLIICDSLMCRHCLHLLALLDHLALIMHANQMEGQNRSRNMVNVFGQFRLYISNGCLIHLGMIALVQIINPSRT